MPNLVSTNYPRINMKTLKTLLSIFVLSFAQTQWQAAPAVSPRLVHDLGQEFSLASNPNGLWTYGYWLIDDIFHPLTASEITLDDLGQPAEVWFNPYDRGIAIFHNSNNFALISNGGDGVHPPLSVWVDPPQTDNGFITGLVTARFTVPETGTYKVKARFEKVLDQVGSAVVVTVLVNQRDQWSVPLDIGSKPAKFQRKLDLKAGDVVDFAVLDAGDGDFGDTVFIDATLEQIER
jgi:hypothetical protein